MKMHLNGRTWFYFSCLCLELEAKNGAITTLETNAKENKRLYEISQATMPKLNAKLSTDVEKSKCEVKTLMQSNESLMAQLSVGMPNRVECWFLLKSGILEGLFEFRDKVSHTCNWKRTFAFCSILSNVSLFCKYPGNQEIHKI